MALKIYKYYVKYVKRLTFSVSSSNIVKLLKTEKSSENAGKTLEVSVSKKVNKIKLKNNLVISCSSKKR